MNRSRINVLVSAALAFASISSAQPTMVGRPAFGTQSATLNLYAWDFKPVDDRIVFGPSAPGSYFKYCVSSIAPYDPMGYLEASVPLPPGTVIDSLTFWACSDIAPGSPGPSVALYVMSPSTPGSSGVIASLQPGPESCGFDYELPVNYTILENEALLYAVEVGLPVGHPNASFSSVQLHYHMEVSQPPPTATFNDVPTTHPFFQYIEALHASGITGGCQASPPLYCPDASVTRGQMAVFLAKALGLYWP